MTRARADFILQYIRHLAGTRQATQAPDAELLGRFTGQRDESAFAALVRRHGPMVLNVCRSVLRHEQDAEDAYQATFLMLARKAASVRHPEAVAGWLYEVAYRVAVHAQSAAARRRDLERRAPPVADADPTLDLTLRDLRRVLHEELRQLPDKYRLPLVLCYLEGRSLEEAAGQLGWSKGAFRGRLDRGREHLRRRLAARGVALAALLSAVAVAPKAAAEALVELVVRGALLSTAGGAGSGVLSTRVAALAEGVSRAMFTGKLKVATAVLLAVGLVAGGAGVVAHQTLTPRERPVGSQQAEISSPKPETAAAKLPAVNDKDTITYGGRVLRPDGRPVAGAKLYLASATYNTWEPSPSPAYATTGPDGRFRFTVPKVKFGGRFTDLAATAANYGPGWLHVLADGKKEDLALRLVDDDMPITGQIVDLEGKPVVGATLRVLRIHAAPGGDLTSGLEAAKGKKGSSGQFEVEYLKRHTIAVSLKVTTDAKGCFRLTGIGRNRLVMAQLDEPSIASQRLRILTRPGPAFEVTEDKGNPEIRIPRAVTTYYGASFRHVAAPGKPIVGVVRDKDTKKPLAGVTILSFKMANHSRHYIDGQELVRTVTDARGHYRLTGMPKGKGNKIKIMPPCDLPYVAIAMEVPDSPGLDPVTVDVELRCGVWIEGKITDKVTGKPLQGGVEYLPMDGNPIVRDYPGFYELFFRFGTVQEDGSYRVVGLPGPGVVGVYPLEPHYLRVSQRQDEHGFKDLSTKSYPYRHFHGSNCGAIVRIDPAKGVGSVKRDVTLDPGWRLTGTVLGPDGKPLAGTRSFLLVGHWWDREATKTAKFSAWFNPHERNDILFQDPEKGLVGLAQPPKENGGSVTVRMEPAAAVTGRLVDADGKLRPGVELAVEFLPKGWGSWFDYSPAPIKTDQNGRFRIDMLLPGCKLRLSDGKGGRLPFGDGLRSGQTQDLGEVQLKRADE